MSAAAPSSRKEPEPARDTIEARMHAARMAYASKDFDAALEIWAAMRADFPDRPEGHWGMGEALRELRRFDEADFALDRAIERFPDNFALALSSAWCAAHRGDWAVAEQRFRHAQPLSDEPRAATFGLGMALFEQSKLPEARRTLLSIHGRGHRDTAKLLGLIRDRLGQKSPRQLTAPDISPDNATIRAASAQQSTNEQHEALRQLIEEGRYEEAEAFCTHMQPLFPADPLFLVEYARLAHRGRRWAIALNRWDAVKTIFPGLPAGYLGTARALDALGRPAEASLILGPALRLFPDHQEMVRIDATAAIKTKNWTLAIQRCRKLQQLQPESPEGFVGEVKTLRLSGDHGAAQEAALHLVGLFPDSPAALMEQAKTCQAAGDIVAALDHWRTIEGRFGRTLESAIGECECLIDTGALQQADALVENALRLFPGEIELLRLHAVLASRQALHELAEARWQKLAEQHPDLLVASLGFARELVAQGHLEAAEDVLNAARPRDPEHLEVDIELVRLQAHRRDWKKALSMLADVKRRHPHHYLVAGAITDILWQVRQDMGVEARETGANTIEIPPLLLGDEGSDQSHPKALLLNFESLGDSCELGMVQRRYGAEPLSLLRWTATPPDRLAMACRERFAAIGDPAQIELDEISGEYVTRIPRYAMFAHTFSLATATPREKFHAAQCKRMAYLRDKLLEDFEAGEKILTYGSAHLDAAAIEALHQAIRRVAPKATLLCVRLAADGEAGGATLRVADKLLIGTISRFSTTDIAVDEWLSLCRAALELHLSDR